MDKSAILILIIGLLVTWLLASSIGALTRFNESGSGPLNIRINLPQPVITLPPINITIPQHASEARGMVLYVPLIPLPIIMPNIPTNLRPMGIAIPSPQQTSAGGSQGASGSQGGLGVGHQYVGNTMVLLKIPPSLIVIALISLIIVIAGSLIMMGRGLHEGARPGNNYGSTWASPRTPINSRHANETFTKLPTEVELLPGEVVRSIGGWGGSAIIDLGIPRDLPLIWSVNEPLPIVIRGDALVTVTGPGILRNSSLVMPSRGCYGINIKFNGGEERLFIRASDYRDDVIKFVRLNIGNAVIKDSATIREVMRQLVNDGIINDDRDSINAVVELFERIRYGLRDVDRRDYEEFLRALGKVFRDAKVVVCEGAQ